MYHCYNNYHHYHQNYNYLHSCSHHQFQTLKYHHHYNYSPTTTNIINIIPPKPPPPREPLINLPPIPPPLTLLLPPQPQPYPYHHNHRHPSQPVLLPPSPPNTYKIEFTNASSGHQPQQSIYSSFTSNKKISETYFPRHPTAGE